VYQELKDNGKISYSSVRKFVVDYLQLDTADMILFAAFEAPIDDPFYLSEEHPDIKTLQKHITKIEIDNYEKY
jgi:hypothetical protein